MAYNEILELLGNDADSLLKHCMPPRPILLTAYL